MRNPPLQLFVIFLLISSLCHAQPNVFKGKFNVFLRSGRVISTDNFRIVRPSSIVIDSVDHIEGVDATGNNRYMKPGLYKGSMVWTERVFQSEHIDVYVTKVTPHKLFNVAWRDYQYTKNNGPLTSLKIKDIERDVRDDPAALAFVKKAKDVRVLQGVFIAGGAALIISGWTYHPKPGFDFTGGLQVIEGVVIGSVAPILRPAKQKNLLKALKAYGPTKSSEIANK